MIDVKKNIKNLMENNLVEKLLSNKEYFDNILNNEFDNFNYHEFDYINSDEDISEVEVEDLYFFFL
jgi:hypothetical protein